MNWKAFGLADVRAVPLCVRERRSPGRGRSSCTRRTRFPPPGAPLFEAATANLNPWTEAKVDRRTRTGGPLLIVSGRQTTPFPGRSRTPRTSARGEPERDGDHRDPRSRSRAHDRRRLARGRRDSARVRPEFRLVSGGDVGDDGRPRRTRTRPAAGDEGAVGRRPALVPGTREDVLLPSRTEARRCRPGDWRAAQRRAHVPRDRSRGEGAAPCVRAASTSRHPHFKGYQAVLLRIPDLDRLSTGRAARPGRGRLAQPRPRRVAKAWLAADEPGD